jgi:hypothetical protein
MRSAKDRLAQVKSILAQYGATSTGDIKFAYDTLAEARQQLAVIRQLQKELRQVKKDIAQDIKEIRASYAAKKARVQASAPLTSLFKLKGAGHYRAIQKQQLAKQQNEAIKPYQNLSMSIDQSLTTLDGVKLKIEAWIIETAKEKPKRG